MVCAPAGTKETTSEAVTCPMPEGNAETPEDCDMRWSAVVAGMAALPWSTFQLFTEIRGIFLI